MKFFNSQNVPQRGGTAILFFTDHLGNFQLMKKSDDGSKVVPISPLDWIRAREHVIYYDYLEDFHPCNYSMTHSQSGLTHTYTFTLNKALYSGEVDEAWDLASAAFKSYYDYTPSPNPKSTYFTSPIYRITLTVTSSGYSSIITTFSDLRAQASKNLCTIPIDDSVTPRAYTLPQLYRRSNVPSPLNPLDFGISQLDFDPDNYSDTDILALQLAIQEERSSGFEPVLAWFYTRNNNLASTILVAEVAENAQFYPFTFEPNGRNGNIWICDTQSSVGIREEVEASFTAYPTGNNWNKVGV